jgi:hypothetical protein
VIETISLSYGPIINIIFISTNYNIRYRLITHSVKVIFSLEYFNFSFIPLIVQSMVEEIYHLSRLPDCAQIKIFGQDHYCGLSQGQVEIWGISFHEMNMISPRGKNYLSGMEV